jgi:hypothetical protein
VLEHVRGRVLASGSVQQQEPDERRQEPGGEEHSPTPARLARLGAATHAREAAGEEPGRDERGEDGSYEIAQRNER